MLSARGQRYADAGLADGYLNGPKNLYDKTTNPHGVVSFKNAENFLMLDEMLNYIKTKCLPILDTSTLTYHEGPMGSTRLRTAMASFVNAHFHPATSIQAGNIVVSTGVTSLNEMCALSLTEPGDGILLGMPIYGSFDKDLRTKSGCELVYTPFHGDDQFGPSAVARYEAALSQARENGVTVKALLLCNPHNPLGRCYSRETLEALLRFCGKHRIHLISDEVYALSVYGGDGGSEFVSILSIDPREIGVDPDLVHVLYGMSKDFAAAGLRLACLISHNQNFLRAIQSISRFHWPSQVSCAIATAILEDREFHQPFLRKSQAILRSRQALAVQLLREAGIPYSEGCTAGFFLWIDLSACLDPKPDGWAAERDLLRKLAEMGVEMASGCAYHDERPGRFRVLFSVDEDTLREGFARIVRFYESHKSG